MWIDLQTGLIARLHTDLRNMRPNWSAPNVLTDEAIAAQEFAVVALVAPTYDPLRQQAIELVPVEQDGAWRQAWDIVDLDADAIATNLKQAKADAWTHIAAHRDAREEAGFKLGDNWFHSDPKSQTKYLGLKDKARDIMAAGGSMTSVIQEQGQNITWHTLNNADVPMTVQLAFDLVAAVATLQATVFMVAKTHRAAMEMSQRPDIYDFSAGWPAAYQGV